MIRKNFESLRSTVQLTDHRTLSRYIPGEEHLDVVPDEGKGGSVEQSIEMAVIQRQVMLYVGTWVSLRRGEA